MFKRQVYDIQLYVLNKHELHCSHTHNMEEIIDMIKCKWFYFKCMQIFAKEYVEIVKMHPWALTCRCIVKLYLN